MPWLEPSFASRHASSVFCAFFGYNSCMSLKPSISIVLSGIILLSGCAKKEVSVIPAVEKETRISGGASSPISRLLKRRLSDASRNSESRSLNEVGQQLRTDFALAPDHRFLDAIATIHHLATGETSEACDVEFSGNKWKIVYKNRPVGEVGEIPDFDLMYKLLTAWARVVSIKGNQTTGAPADVAANVFSSLETSLAKMTPDSIFATLREIEKQQDSQKNNPQLLRLAARALSLLAMQSFDSLEINDRLASSALAYLAFSEVAGAKNLLQERALIADFLNYHKAARAAALQLPVGNIVRLYFEDNVAGLEAVAAKSSADHLADYLYLRSICRNRDKKLWRQWLERHRKDLAFSNLSVLKASAEMNVEEMLMPIAVQIIGTAKSEAAGSKDELKPGSLEWKDVADQLPSVSALLGPNLLDDFEKSLFHSKGERVAKEIAEFEGVEFDDSFRRMYYRAYFFSAIDIIARTTLALPSARLFSARLAECLKYSGPAPSNQLAPWVMAMSSGYSGAATDKDLQSWLLSMEGLGPSAVVSVFASCRDLQPSADLIFSAGEMLFIRSDTRPSIRLPLANVAEQVLLDLKIHRRLVGAAIRDGVGNGFQTNMLLSRMVGNKSEILTLLQSKKATLQEKLALLQFLHSIADEKKEVVITQYTNLIKENSSSWDATREFVAYLSKVDKGMAILEIRKWLAASAKGSKSKAPTQEQFHARLILAQLLYDANDISALKAELKSLPKNNARTYLKLQALSELASGKTGSAKAWSEFYSNTFKNSLDPLLVQLEIAWKQKEFVQAANILARAPQISRIVWKEEIGALLMRTYPNDRQVYSATTALLHAGFVSDDSLGQIAAAAFSADRADLAFTILSSVNYKPQDAADIKTCLYRYLKRAKGKDAAIAWLKTQIPEKERASIAPFAFIAGQDELLFEFAPLEDVLDSGELIWILRAASTVLNPELRTKWADQLRAHFSGRTDWSGIIGCYLISESPDAQLVNTLENTKVSSQDRARAAFYLAWKKLAEKGDFLDDTEWLRRCLFERQAALPEDGWSMVWLRDITNTLKGQPLIYSDSRLQELRVVAPQSGGAWSEQRRFKLTTN